MPGQSITISRTETSNKEDGVSQCNEMLVLYEKRHASTRAILKKQLRIYFLHNKSICLPI